MSHIVNSVYKLEIFSSRPENFEGKLFSFSFIDGVHHIDVSLDPFDAIKKAALSALGNRCGLVTENLCFFSELFSSTYENLMLSFLETKDFMKAHVSSFLAKKKGHFSLAHYRGVEDCPVIVIGKGASLRDDFAFIKAHEQKAFIVAAYSVLPFLNEHGIHVDQAFAIDPAQFIHHAKNATTLMLTAKANFEVAEGFKNICLFPESFCEFSNFIFQKNLGAPVYGYTVIDMAIKHLVQQGFRHFYLSGIDLNETGGVYIDNTSCGFKPDFKKAKEHLCFLKDHGISILPLKSLDRSIFKKESLGIEFSDFDGQEFFDLFDKSLQKLKKLDFQSLGLYEMFELENEPFYRIVLEPLYEKIKLLDETLVKDKRVFFASVLERFK